jgi:hypothetical protein
MSEKDERYTPEDLARRVRDTLGGEIAIDFMSCAEANAVVGAQQFFTKENSWLSKFLPARYFSSAYLNPPGSLRLEAHRRFARWWLEERFVCGCVCLYDWDHSTEWFKVIADLNPVYALLKKRAKFSNKDVGRSQAFAFVGVQSYVVRKFWGDIAYIMSPVRHIATTPPPARAL